MTWKPYALIFVAGLLASPSARAADGVIEINQVIAERGSVGGAGAADPAGFPVTITEPGSYQLTSNLLVGAGTTGISIQAPDVTLDLGGFTVQGPVVCQRAAEIVCDPPSGGGQSGVVSSQPGATVRNGRIQGFESGLLLADVCRVDGVMVRWNSGNGITVGESCLVHGVGATLNGANGIVIGADAFVSSSLADFNGSTGIRGSTAGIILRSVTRNNIGDGMFVGEGGIVSGCTSDRNGDDGIGANAGSLVEGSTAAYNDDFGLVLSTAAGYANDAIESTEGIGARSAMGIDTRSGKTVIGGTALPPNACDGDATCP